MWFNTNNGRLHIYYGPDPSGTTQWVDVSLIGFDSGGDGGIIDPGVTKIIAGANITISPANGTGEVTINGQAGGGGGDGGDTIINYNGAAAWGTVAGNGTLLGGMNCTITKNPGNGSYTVNFINPLPDANYSVTTGAANTNATPIKITAKGVNSFQVDTATSGQVAADLPFNFAVHALNALPPQGGTGTDAWATVSLTNVNGACNVPGSFNVESVSRTGEGRYSVVFNTDMPSVNYAVTGSADTNNNEAPINFKYTNKSVSGFDVVLSYTKISGGTSQSFIDFGFSFTVNATNAVLPATRSLKIKLQH